MNEMLAGFNFGGAFNKALRTFVQSLTAILIVETGIFSVDWVDGLEAAGLAALICLLQNVVEGNFTTKTEPATVTEDTPPTWHA